MTEVVTDATRALSLPAMHQSMMGTVLATDRASYMDSEEALFTITATDGEGPVQGAVVRVEITNAFGHELAAEATTGSDGVASLRFMVDAKRDGAGLYAVEATTSRGGYDPARGYAVIEVRGEPAARAPGPGRP